jgi:hypothetical protein
MAIFDFFDHLKVLDFDGDAALNSSSQFDG